MDKPRFVPDENAPPSVSPGTLHGLQDLLQGRGPTGLDLVRTDTFRDVPPVVLRESFSDRELDYAAGRPRPDETLAGFWAAKEAFLKATGLGIASGVVSPAEVEVTHDAAGAPFLILPPRLLDALGISLLDLRLAITHGGDYAAALVLLPLGTRPLAGPSGMAKTGGIKNYEKTRADVLTLLRGVDAAEAPPRPVLDASAEALALLAPWREDPVVGPVLALADRCGVAIRVADVHPQAFENLDNAEESNDFRKLAPYAQLHFLALTVDRDTYGTLPDAPPLAPGERGALLVNRGLLVGPADLADARDTLLRAEIVHEAVHFERPVFRTEGADLLEEWFEETAGLARQVAALLGVSEDARRRAEALVTDTLEGNPVRASFDLEQGDGTTRRIASKTFMVLEMELAEVHRTFGTLTPDGMSTSLFRVVDRYAADPALAEAGALTDAGLEELLRYATRQDRDLRRPVAREMGVQLQELVVPAGAAGEVRRILTRTAALVDGSVEPAGGALVPAPTPPAPIEAKVVPTAAVAADPFEAETRSRSLRQPVAPSRSRTASLSVEVAPDGLDEGVPADPVLDLREERVSTQARKDHLARALHAGRAAAARGQRFALRVSRRPEEALDEIRAFLPELRDAVTDVVVEAVDPSFTWRVDDLLGELEAVLGLPVGAVGLELAVERLAVLHRADRLLGCTPRISAVEIGRFLAASGGYVFEDRAVEDAARAADRRLDEQDAFLVRWTAPLAAAAASLGIPMIRALPPLGATTASGMHRLSGRWASFRVVGVDDARRFHLAAAPAPLLARLADLEIRVQVRSKASASDPVADFTLEEDLRVLEDAVARGLLVGEDLERYWRARWFLLYDPGVPATLPIPPLDLPRALREAAASRPDRCFRVRTERVRADGVREVVSADLPFLDVLGPASNRVAHALLRLGVGKGDRVAISTSNTIACILAFQGAARAGAVVVPLDPTKAHLADRFFNDAAVKVLFFDAGGGGDDADLHHARVLAWVREQGLDEDRAFLAELRKARRRIASEAAAETGASLAALLPEEARAGFLAIWSHKLDPSRKFAESLPRVPSLTTVVLTSVEDGIPGVEPGPVPEGASVLAAALGAGVRVVRFPDLLADAPDSEPPVDLGPDDPVAWPYTGGTTTGVSKAAVHTHRSLLALGLQRGLSMIPDGDRARHAVATTLPFTHTYGFATGVLTPVLTGSDAVVVPNTGPRYLSIVAEALVSERVTDLFSSRSALSTLVRLVPGGADLSSLRRIASSGDTLTPAVVEEWVTRFGVAPNSGYGSTETPSSLMNPSGTNRLGAEGIPVPNVEARVVDAETGAPLPPGRPGLLQVRGPHVCVGYAGRPDATSRCQKPGGWWQKDDIFKMDADGFFVFCGRADDMFTVNELNVYPETVEQALLTVPGVAEVGVIGVFDSDLQTNRVKAFVVLEPGADLTPASLVEAARPLLEAHEAPTLVEIVDDLAKSNFGKLARNQLRKDETKKVAPGGAPASGSVDGPVAVPPPLAVAETVLVFPTGGSHWPGMGADLDLVPEGRDLLDRAEAALAPLGVPAGALRSLLAGDGQAERVAGRDGWSWTGDFPLSVAAQTVVGVGLGRAFVARFGAPRAVVGESMGEAAAYAVAGALDLEDAVTLAWRQAVALATVSDALGLRMAVVEGLDAEALAEVGAPFDARVVIAEAPRLFVVALPAVHLSALEQAGAARGARVLVSNNPCAAHDPRLGGDHPARRDLAAFVATLPLRTPTLTLLSTLVPGRVLDGEDALRTNLLDTFQTPVRWASTLGEAVRAGARALVQLGAQGSAYALERLREAGGLPVEASDGEVSIRATGTLAGVDTLDAVPGRCATGDAVSVDGAFVRALARSSGDRNSYHLDAAYARRTRYGAVILHGVGTEGLGLVAVARAFPSLEITRAEQPSFKVPVKVGDTVRTVVEVRENRGNELEVAFFVLNGWSDLLLEGQAWLAPRLAQARSPLPPVDLSTWGDGVEPFAPRPAPDFQPGDTATWPFALDEERLAATAGLFDGGPGVDAAALGLQLLSFGSASFAPGFVLTGTSLLDVRRALADLRRSLARAGVDDAVVLGALDRASSLDALLDALPLAGKAGKTVRRQVTATTRAVADRLLGSPEGRSAWNATWRNAEAPVGPGDLSVRTSVASLEGAAPQRNVTLSIDVTDASGRLLYAGGVTKAESPPEAPAEEADPVEVLAARLLQQKVINVFPVTRPRDAENSSADPSVNAALLDLEDAVSPVMRKTARPRAVEMISRIRRDSSAAKKGLVAALQTARSRTRGAALAEALMDPTVRDLDTLIAKLDFRKKGADEFRAAMKRPQQRLLATYLANEGTRAALLDAVGHLDFAGKVVKLRPNNVRTSASAADYWGVIRHVGDRLDALTIPKSRDPAEIVAIDRALTALELSRGWPVGHLKLELLVEHPLAVVLVDEIAAASPRTISLIYGHVDYVAATGGWSQDHQFEYQRHAKRRTVEAAHANGQIAIDAITPAINAEAARADAVRSVEMGFDGKWSIHLDHIEGIKQVEFPRPVLRLRAHEGAARFAEGPMDLGELQALAEADRPLFPKPLPPVRPHPADRRAILRVGLDDLAGLEPAEVATPADPPPVVWVEVPADTCLRDRMDDLGRLAALGDRGAVVLPPDASPHALGALRDFATLLVLEAAPGGPSLTVDAIRDAAAAWGGPVHLSLTRPDEIRSAFALARDCEAVVALVHSTGDGEAWDDLGAVLAAASALRIDALQGVDDEGDRWFHRAFRLAHMGLRGQVTRRVERLPEVRRAYTPTAELIREAVAVVERYYKAERIEQVGAIPFEFTYLLPGPTRGLVDAATAKIYDVVLNRAAELGLLDPEQDEAWRSYTRRWVWNDTGEEVDFTRWRWVAGDPDHIEIRTDPSIRAERGEGPGRFSPAPET